MRYLTLGEVVELHRLVLGATGGAPGIRDLGALESAIAQPKTTFAGTEVDAPVDAQERLTLDLAAGRITRSQLTDWLRQHLKPPA
jgi:death-on-curing protein